MFQLTIFLLYVAAAIAFAWTRTAQEPQKNRLYLSIAVALTAVAIVTHGWQLHRALMPGGHFTLTITGAISLIGLQLGLIAALAAFDAALRGVSSILLLISATMGSLTYILMPMAPSSALTWQMQTHIALSMFAYGLLTAGAIVAVLALVQDRRLRTRRLSPINVLFAPLQLTEKLLFGIATTGFVVLLMSVVTGFTFVENLFAQHLVHKTVLSLIALLMFGTLVIGRQLAGWRGKRAVYLYLGGFVLLLLAYFGTRYILENLLQTSWG